MKTRVTIDGRRFDVIHNDDFRPSRIVERKLYAAGQPWECWYNAPYWSAKHHNIGKPKTLVARILKEAKCFM